MPSTEATPRPWMKQPGELHDKKGVPIYPGDLLRSFHFFGSRKKRHYLYHTAVFRDGAMFVVPTSHLEPTKISGGGSCPLDERLAAEAEVISGHGPGRTLSFEDRPKAALAALRETGGVG